MDSFGRKYLASDVMNGELMDGEKHTNKHLQKFAKTSKPLVFWHSRKWIYKKRMRKAKRQKNTYLDKRKLSFKDVAPKNKNK